MVHWDSTPLWPDAKNNAETFLDANTLNSIKSQLGWTGALGTPAARINAWCHGEDPRTSTTCRLAERPVSIPLAKGHVETLPIMCHQVMSRWLTRQRIVPLLALTLHHALVSSIAMVTQPVKAHVLFLYLHGLEVMGRSQRGFNLWPVVAPTAL